MVPSSVFSFCQIIVDITDQCIYYSCLFHLHIISQDQPVCTHYSRHGICKYGRSCRYNHPVDSNPSASPAAAAQSSYKVFPETSIDSQEVKTEACANPVQESEWWLCSIFATACLVFASSLPIYSAKETTFVRSAHLHSAAETAAFALSRFHVSDSPFLFLFPFFFV